MTNGIGFIERAGQRAQALPLARIAAAMLGGSAAFFALAMPPRIVSGLLDLAGMSVAVGLVGRLLFAILFALLAAAAGWLALTLAAGAPLPATAFRLPRVARKRPVAATGGDPAPTLRRGDAHPDAPPRRPIFAKDDLGTPFDEIVTDRRIVRGAPEPEFAASDAAIDLDSPPIPQSPAAERAAFEDEPVVEDMPIVDPPVAADRSPAPASAPNRSPESPPPATPREGDSIAALMARFEGGLDRLGGGMLPPPDISALGALRRSARNPDDALRDALEALQQMAARQR